MTYRKGTCARPDPGWNCLGDDGHDGPCASWPDDPRLDPSYLPPEDEEKMLEALYGCFVAIVVAAILGLVAIGFLVGVALS